jgi:hypothetical protein
MAYPCELVYCLNQNARDTQDKKSKNESYHTSPVTAFIPVILKIPTILILTQKMSARNTHIHTIRIKVMLQ